MVERQRKVRQTTAEILLRETNADFGRLMEQRGASIHRIRAKIALRTGVDSVRADHGAGSDAACA